MSKIQDAIRRLQDAGPAPQERKQRPPRQANEESLTVAKLKLPDAKLSDSPKSVAFVDVDYESLRQQGLLAPTTQQKHIADQYRLIKRPLLDNISGKTAHQSGDSNLIMVASALSGDGKTFNCMNLALSMATEKDKTVLLVDADVSKPHISTLFGIEGELGLLDLLIDSTLNISDIVLPTNVPGLHLLPAGTRDEHATELLASRRMAVLVEKLSKAYQDGVVLFDSPPLLQTSESRVLASRMGQISLVVCSNVTPKHAVLDAIDSLDPEKALSIILNRSNKGFGASNYGGYGYGYQ